MDRVAAKKDRSEFERTHYVYVQHGHTISRKGKTVRCEEMTDYRITPTKESFSPNRRPGHITANAEGLVGCHRSLEAVGTTQNSPLRQH